MILEVAEIFRRHLNDPDAGLEAHLSALEIAPGHKRPTVEDVEIEDPSQVDPAKWSQSGKDLTSILVRAELGRTTTLVHDALLDSMLVPVVIGIRLARPDPVLEYIEVGYLIRAMIASCRALVASQDGAIRGVRVMGVDEWTARERVDVPLEGARLYEVEIVVQAIDETI